MNEKRKDMKIDRGRVAAAAALVAALAGCTPEVGSERWCEKLGAKPKNEWSMREAADYAKHCIFESTSVGSDRWCEKLAAKPKGEWTANEAADYAKHCLLKGSGSNN